MHQMTSIGPHLLSSPVLSDEGVLALLNSPYLRVHQVDTTFAVNVHDLEIDLELNRVIDEVCVCMCVLYTILCDNYTI